MRVADGGVNFHCPSYGLPVGVRAWITNNAMVEQFVIGIGGYNPSHDISKID